MNNLRLLIMNEMLSSGIELMLIGMGIVFAFLAMLVVAIGFMSTLIQRFFRKSLVYTLHLVNSDTPRKTQVW